MESHRINTSRVELLSFVCTQITQRGSYQDSLIQQSEGGPRLVLSLSVYGWGPTLDLEKFLVLDLEAPESEATILLPFDLQSWPDAQHGNNFSINICLSE